MALLGGDERGERLWFVSSLYVHAVNVADIQMAYQWTAPILAQASIAATARGIIGI